ncbi:MAG: sigma-70 family RNA polymerase sigma factor [Candidatus Latescibacterota bacterium]
MDELHTLVTRAQRGERRAFGDLVQRFQDMAVGYAFSVLGDWHRAEDAAQEAFVRAYLDLAALREPAAFAGWLRRIVFARCRRGTRGKCLDVVPLERAGAMAEDRPDPQEAAIADELRCLVHQALAELPEHQRRVTTLFYLADCSHQEIAAFLEVPVGTVKKRLHDARKRLRERMTEMTSESLHEGAPSHRPQFVRRVLEGIEPRRGDSTVLGTFHPVLQAAGATLSVARLAGTLGHAFTFSMKRDGSEVWQQANLDWWLFFDDLPWVGYRFQHFQGILKGAVPAPGPEALTAPNEEAWKAVRQSIDRGVPAVAWQPMTVAQRDAGASAFEWGLLVGYDEGQATYTVRHPYYRVEYEVPHDQFGHTDPVHWYYVIVLAEPSPVEPRAAARRALGHAVDFAHGRRFQGQGACYWVDAVGLAAYDLWRETLNEGKATARRTTATAAGLRWSRQWAAEYLRELASELPEARQPLQAGAACYDQQAGVLRELEDACRGAGEPAPPAALAGREEAADLWPGAQAQRAADLVGAALEAERGAVVQIERALAALRG